MRLPLTKRRFPAAPSGRACSRARVLLSAATAVTAAAAVLIAASPARANGPDPALCSSDSSRVLIPASLPVNACFDGHNLVIENSQQFPIEVRTDHGGVPVVAPTASADLPGSIVSMMAPMDDGLTPPNYKLTIPISSQQTTITIIQAPGDIVSDYTWGEALYGALGGTLVTGLGKSLASLLGELTTVTQNYRTCLIAATSWLGRIGCAAGYDANVVYALGRFGLTLAPNVIQATYNLVMTAIGANQAVGQVAAWVHGIRQFTIAAAPSRSSAGGGGIGSQPSSGAGPGSPISPVPGNAAISIGWSTAHPGWITMTLTNLPPGTYTYTCNFASGGNASYTLTETSSPQTFDNGRTCYDKTGGDTVWVTIGSVRSNTITVPSTPSPAPPSTFAETVGGLAHTWTNYANAGGTQGPSIAAYTTVQVACKVPGFKVADGNTWWYRIASSPWNGTFYASADAFYNDGRTSGSLSGTPFYDPRVLNC